MENPFNSAANPTATQQIVITERAAVRESRPEIQSEEISKLDNSKNPLEQKQKKEACKPEEEKPEAGKHEEDTPSEREPVTCIGAEIYLKEKSARSISLSKPEPQPIERDEPAQKNNNKPDLITIAGLTGWVENSTEKLGRDRTEAVLDISQAMGYVSSEIKPILIKLISLATQSSVERSIRTRDYIDSLIKLNSLLNKDNREDAALLLLSMVSGEVNHG